ncbi:MAG: hypothetical protein QOD72_2665, partial [Acidimicrobiaceae bacterium]|nr:hypothetical protein [Acidimicrobiaceae bacterium]
GSTKGSERMSAAIAAGLVALAGVAFLIGWHRINGPFGESHDGRNAAVWVYAADGIDAHGLVGSRLGATRASGEVYANHPPLVGVATWVASKVTGRRPVGIRAPAVLGSLASLLLLYLLGRSAGIGRIASALGVAAAGATPMFRVYGAMVDTAMLSLPFGLAMLLAWRRAAAGRPWSPVLVASVTAIALLSGWQVWLTVAVVVVGLVWQRVCREHRGWLPVSIGAVVGVVAVCSWEWWATGSLANLVDQFTIRSVGTTHVSWRQWLEAQRSFFGDLFPVALLVLGLGGIVVGLVHRSSRSLIAALVGITVPWVLLLRNGSFIHDYWAYWLTAPLAIGVAVLAHRAASLASRAGSPRARAVLASVAGLGALAWAVTASPSSAQRRIDQGMVAARLVERAHWQAEQTRAWCVGGNCVFAPWLEFITGRPPGRVATADELATLGRDHPTDLVLVSSWNRPAWLDAQTPPGYLLVAASTLKTQPP